MQGISAAAGQLKDWVETRLDGREAGSNRHRTKGHKVTNTVEARWREGRMDMVPMGGLCWLVLDMGPCFISSDRRDAWHSAANRGRWYLQIRPGGWMVNRNRQRVPFCNALFIHQRQVCMDRRDFRLSCKSCSILGKEDDRMGLGLEDRRSFSS